MLYADDTQIYGSCRSGGAESLLLNLGMCIDQVADWMGSGHLQLSATKMEFMWCAPLHRRYQVSSQPQYIWSVSMSPVESMRDLGVNIDSEMSMNSHVTRTVS
jgi:hypothetical protein